MHRKPPLCTGFINVFIANAAPTCFGTYVPSSGSVFALVSNVKTKAAMYSYVTRLLYILGAIHSYLSFHITHKDKDTL
jgi:hypothetical protein